MPAALRVAPAVAAPRAVPAAPAVAAPRAVPAALAAVVYWDERYGAGFSMGGVRTGR